MEQKIYHSGQLNKHGELPEEKAVQKEVKVLHRGFDDFIKDLDVILDSNDSLTNKVASIASLRDSYVSGSNSEASLKERLEAAEAKIAELEAEDDADEE